MARKSKHYVVWEGRRKGIFDSWSAAEAQVKGYAGAKHKAFESLEAARAAFGSDPQRHIGQKPRADSRKASGAVLAPVWDSYSVDAACSGNPGVLEYRCVRTDSREAVFAWGPYARGTNNVGEFLALVEALALCVRNGDPRPVYTDSATAMAWLRDRRAKTQLREQLSPELRERLERAEAWLASHSYPNRVLKWDSEAWGENPADYGRKWGNRAVR